MWIGEGDDELMKRGCWCTDAVGIDFSGLADFLILLAVVQDVSPAEELALLVTSLSHLLLCVCVCCVCQPPAQVRVLSCLLPISIGQHMYLYMPVDTGKRVCEQGVCLCFASRQRIECVLIFLTICHPLRRQSVQSYEA